MKQKTNGFTLVEMLSVIALLAALALVVIPNVDKLLKTSKNELYINQINLIKTGAQLWATDIENQNMLSSNEVWPYVITLYDLQESKYVDKDIIDPKTDQKFSENMLIYINKVNSKYIYTIDEESNDPLAPIIIINGDRVISLEIGSSYTELGASATKPDGSSLSVTTSIKKDGTVSTINTSQKGNYIITYSATYIEGSVEHSATLARIVKIIDTTPPVITCETCGSGTIDLESTDSYILPTVTVTDNSGEEIKAILMGSFTTRIPGNKIVKYVATDSSGNTAVYTLNFNIRDTISPTVTYSTKIEGTSITYEVIAVDTGSGIKEYSFDGGSTWQKSNTRSLKCNSPTAIVVKDNAGNTTTKDISSNCENIWAYAYTGESQTFTVPYSGWYQIELWGASGKTSSLANGKGAYTSGKTFLTKDEIIYFYIGGVGTSGTSNLEVTGGYNGGGSALGNTDGNNSSGGGATDVRLINGAWNNAASLASRIMVSGGGGGGVAPMTTVGQGGTLIATNAVGAYSVTAGGGTQISGGTSGGTFGVGGNGTTTNRAGGGGGYYGGGTASNSGAGGSSFISGYAGVNAITSQTSLTPTNNTIHYSGKYFINGVMQSGINSGNGKAVITYVDESKPERINLALNGVRYIKDCANGSEKNTSTHWVELQAIVNGVNVAKGKTVTGTSPYHTSFQPYTIITDGDITTSNYAQPNTSGSTQCITVDLGALYNLDEIAVWHYYHDNRTYNSNVTSVSSNNSSWTTVIANTSNETVLGKRVDAYTYPKYEYTYTGGSQTFTVPYSGWYQLETWGAEGGNATYTTTYTGGLGGYAKGNIYLTQGEVLYIYVGGQGQTVSGTSTGTLTPNGNGYNGGGYGCFATNNNVKGGGGGATDIRLTSGTWNNIQSLRSRIIVAGGGGAASSHSTAPNYSGNGGIGGSLVGGKGLTVNTTCYAYGYGGTQISGGYSITCATNGQAYAGVATFGVGYTPYSAYSSSGNVGGGAGGYYGGGAGYHAPSAGGSSFISGFAGVNAVTSESSTTATNNTIHYSGKYFLNGQLIDGVNRGNGRSSITYIGRTEDLKRFNTTLDNVRYIKDCINGSTVNNGNHWIELQALVNGVNIAKGKTITGTSTITNPSHITDGDISTFSNYTSLVSGSLQCVTVDLGQVYNLDEIAVWHYWPDSRTYNSNVTYVSTDNANWITAIANNEAETPNGKRISAYQN